LFTYDNALHKLMKSHMPIKTIRQYVEWIVEGDGTLVRRLDINATKKKIEYTL